MVMLIFKFDRLLKFLVLKLLVKLVIFILINDKLIEVIIMFVVNGVIICFRCVIKRLNNILMKVLVMVKLNNIVKMFLVVLLLFFIFVFVSSSVLINVKLVFCMVISLLLKGLICLV